MSKKNKLLTAVFVAGCIAIFGVAMVVRAVSVGDLNNTNEIAGGVMIGDVDVSGMTKDEALQAVEEYIQKMQNRTLYVNVDEHTVTASFGAVGFAYKESDALEEAFELGKNGGVIHRLQELSRLQEEGANYPIEFTVDEEKLKDFVKTNCSKYDVEMKNSRLMLVNGVFEATKEKKGRKVQVKETVTTIAEALRESGQAESITVDAVLQVVEPKYTREVVSRCQDLLGAYTTSFATSTSARATNVQTAANYINGTVLYPGKTFSTIKVIKDRTVENGYQTAAEYSSGKVVDGVGGGVCQVSTTLYNAVINAELEIVERSPHSMVVSYVDVSRDAAIAGDYKDFKFKNNTDVPIYIAASAEGGMLSFRIYGEEKRAENRTIEFESKILEEIQPGEEVVTVDKSLPEDYREVTQSAHVGYKAELWKIIYIDGVESERVLINSSSYSAEPQYVTVGKKADSTPQPSADSEAEATKKPKEKEEKATSTPQPEPTKEPKVTEEPAETE